MSKPKTTTVSFEVTLPPDGWEVSNRRPNDGELCRAYISGSWSTPGTSHWDKNYFIFAYPKIDKWNQQLEALKLADGWVAVDRDGRIFWFDKKPKADTEVWFALEALNEKLDVPCKMFGLPIPKYEGDWKKSLRQIKNHKVVTP